VMEHKRPSPIGAEVVVEAELTEVDDRRLVFSIRARQIGTRDDVVVVGGGTLERALVDKDRFVRRAQHY
jgi:fluoroacetyl-CoA thioesterase